ncbi:hypothetical protein GCM10025759_27350 [Lysobacter panacisoli]|uniref:DUF3617 family protein n=1 Tax=Lysobacter panacisoli TaxID=1255263 RepID=A0ABP9LN52_9GAMM
MDEQFYLTKEGKMCAAANEQNDFSGQCEDEGYKEAMSLFSVYPRAMASDSGLDELDGYYRMNAIRCTPAGEHAPCRGELKDCLRIETYRGSHRVEVYSTQAYQHVCAFSIEMRGVNGELVYDSPLGQVILRRVGNQLVIASDGIDPTAGGLGFCGAHADIDMLAFPLSGKVETDAQCFRDGP